MLAKYFVGFNWVDFLIVGIIVRMCFIGVKTGVGIELFKLLSLWLATVITLHVYTTPVSDLLNQKLPALPLDAGDVFVFIVLMTVIVLAVRIIRESFFLLVKIEAHNNLDRWGGFFIGAIRGFWIASIALFIMTISTIRYLEVSAKSSLFGHKIISLAPQIYKSSFEGLISKFLVQGQLNPEVSKALER
jgi:uncharacterized membrane protein required for colicin V production